jgi:hypothetical protein
MFLDLSTTPEDCYGELSYFYMQYQCVQTDEMLAEKYD